MKKRKSDVSDEITVSDRRKHPFYLIENSLIDDHCPAIGVYGIAVYNVLAYYANQEDAAWPSYQTIADKIGASRPKVIETVKMLVERGIILKHDRKTPAGDPTSNEYVLINITVVNDIDQGGKPRLPPSKPHLPPSKQDLPGVVNDIDQGGKPRLPEQNPLEQNPLEQNPGNEREHPQGMDDLFDFDDDPPTLSQQPPLDHSKLIKGKIPAGYGKTPAEVFFEIHPYSAPLSHAVTDDLVMQSVSDLGRWREAVRYWKLEGYKPGNIRGQLDWYHGGVPQRTPNSINGANNGTYRRSSGFVRRDGAADNTEPEFVPDAEFLAQMERFNARRAGRAVAGS